MNVKLVAAAVSAAAMAACTPDLSLQADAPPRTAEMRADGSRDPAAAPAVREAPKEGASTATPAADKAVAIDAKGN